MKREYFADVSKGGTLLFLAPASEEEGRLSLCGKQITVTYKTTRKPKKYLQYRYYHGVMVKQIHYTFTELGHRVTLDGVDDMLKAKFNGVQVVCESTGEILTVTETTTELETWEYEAKFIEPIRQWFFEAFGIMIDPPNKDQVAQQIAQEELEKKVGELKNGNA